MKNKKLYIIVLFLIILFSFLTFLVSVISENQKIVKFAYTYWLIEKKSDIIKNSNIGYPCYFSEMKLNDVELKCQTLNQFCNTEIPAKIFRNKDTACAILTFDINGFNKKPNVISSNKNIQDQYQVLMYRNGITTIPDSVENEALYYKKPHSFKVRLQKILLLCEITKHRHL